MCSISLGEILKVKPLYAHVSWSRDSVLVHQGDLGGFKWFSQTRAQGAAVPPSPRLTMWLPRLALLLLLLRISGVLLVEGINTCQSINLDRQKSRRIEAVRGQILSKLRIRSPPDDDDDDDEEPPAGPVPPEVVLLYNSTRELLKERVRLAESACERESSEEDYYAKEVQRIDMLPPRTDTSESLHEDGCRCGVTEGVRYPNFTSLY